MKPIRKHIIKKLAALGLAAGCLMGLTACGYNYAESSETGRTALVKIGDICEQYEGKITSSRNGFLDVAIIECHIPDAVLEDAK